MHSKVYIKSQNTARYLFRKSFLEGTIATLLRMSSPDSKWQDLTGKLTSEPCQISRFFFSLLDQHRFIGNFVWEEALPRNKYDFIGQTFRTYRRKSYILKVPILEGRNVCYEITNSFDIKKTVQIKFGLRIPVFINHRDTGLRLKIYCLGPALYRATDISTLLKFLTKFLVYSYFSKQK